ncbi:MAG: 50S ribosomal protein L29 [Gloeocapsa sp. DLM2.Bin57]|nr:MAG: 50S ribosomal protein L29 [Gloeocapsa sp. DLM2.Bin57]
MALSKIADVRKMSDAEVAEAIVQVKRELFNLRLEQATGRLEKTHLFKHKRHYLGQLLTIERERQLNINTSVAEQ